jgi:hypothetical protein
MNAGYMLKFITIVGFITFVFITVFGLPLSISNGFHIDGIQCFASERATSCQNINEHIENWQNSFIATVSDFLLLIVFLASSLVLFAISKLHWRSTVKIRPYINWRYFSSNPMQIAFAKGIVQPTL